MGISVRALRAYLCLTDTVSNSFEIMPLQIRPVRFCCHEFWLPRTFLHIFGKISFSHGIRSETIRQRFLSIIDSREVTLRRSQLRPTFFVTKLYIPLHFTLNHPSRTSVNLLLEFHFFGKFDTILKSMIVKMCYLFIYFIAVVYSTDVRS